MKHTIYPCLWFDGNAKQAAEFYCAIFNNAKITTNTPMVVNFEIEGSKIMGLNGGPMFKINPSISLMVTCSTKEETDQIWNKLTEGGSTMMPLNKYPWSELYGWGVDKFGMTWQIMLGELPEGSQKIIPCFLFVGDQYGKALPAIKEYASIFPDSTIGTPQIYQAGETQPEGNLKFGHLFLKGSTFAAMDGFGAMEFKFNEAVSIMVECSTQDEIDHYWNALIADGGKESRCGWLKDKYGVSWQIVPNNIGSLMTDPERSKRIMQAIMGMNKLDMAALANA